MLKKCFLRIFNQTDYEVDKVLKVSLKKIYGTSAIVGPPYFEVTEWNEIPQIEITGMGDDGRCSVCEYASKLVGKDKIRRNNCPF